MELNYIRAIQNSLGIKNKAEKQAETVRRNVEKYFNQTYGTQQCFVNGRPQELIVTHVTGDDRKKNIITRPSETIYAGDIVECYDQKWIVLDIDPNKTIYTKGQMQLCNIIVRWISKKNNCVVERYGWAENVTKYSSGVRDSNTVQRTEFQIKIRLRCDEETALLKRDDRFLLDLDNQKYDTSLKSGHPDAYILTNRDIFTRRDSFGKRQNGGIVELTLTEHLFNYETDNADLMIADYYNTEQSKSCACCPVTAKINYRGSLKLQSNGNFKTFTPEFYSNGNNVTEEAQAVWSVTTDEKYMQYINTETDGNILKVKVRDDGAMVGAKITITLQDEDSSAKHSITAEVVDLL